MIVIVMCVCTGVYAVSLQDLTVRLGLHVNQFRVVTVPRGGAFSRELIELLKRQSSDTDIIFTAHTGCQHGARKKELGVTLANVGRFEQITSARAFWFDQERWSWEEIQA